MTASPQQKRAFWLRHLHNWHWISSAICLIAMMLFTVTGFTLNHAADIEAHPQVSKIQGTLPTQLLNQLQAELPKHLEKNSDLELPAYLQTWLEQQHHIESAGKPAEWSPEEIYLALPRPGGDAWLRLSVETGELEYEKTVRGSIAYLNDLHKGRNAGKVWSWFIDLFALTCLIFCITGLFLLKMHANSRVLTWPLVVLGLVMPLILAVMMH